MEKTLEKIRSFFNSEIMRAIANGMITAHVQSFTL